MSERGERGETDPELAQGSPPSEAKPASRRSRRGRSARAEAGEAPERATSGLAGVASSIAGAAGPVISAARRPVDQLASGARRLIDERPGARVRQVRRMGRQPLPNLWEVHPEARRAAIRELGLQTVLLEDIVGTAVEGAAQRGGDFLPLRDRRGDDWRARWQRILAAVENLIDLPPVELLKFGDKHWVVDGHNRVAAGLYSGQVAIDAVVYELRLPGVPSQRSTANIAPYLEGSRDLRAAGSGRLTRTSSRPDDYRGEPARPTDDERAGRRTGDAAQSHDETPGDDGTAGGEQG